jgi:hypothetical protein
MSNEGKTHYRKAFNSPYLSSADIVETTTLTVTHVTLSPDATKKSSDVFNTAHFAEKEIRKGEKLKPMILNATNSATMKKLTGSAFIEDWKNVRINVYVDSAVRFGRDTVEGLRISTKPPEAATPGATDEQLATIKDYRESGVMKPETAAWIDSHGLNIKTAAKIIEGMREIENAE